MPELGQVSREQVAALAGLAPFVQQSGTQQGQTHIGGGRSRLRRSLYAAALPGAHRSIPALIDLDRMLCARKAARHRPDLWRTGRLRAQAAGLRQRRRAARPAWQPGHPTGAN